MSAIAAGHDNRVTERIAALARTLISIPSRAGIDPPAEIVLFVADWCAANGVPARVLSVGGTEVGVTAVLERGDGPALCLDACLDTAPFGDEARWRFAPTSAAIEGERMYGRGSADSKTAAAMFLVLVSEFAGTEVLRRGALHLLLDADEHTGAFGGVKEFVRTTKRQPNAVWIGYPGNHTIVAGSRGFLRGRLRVGGVAAHTGSKRKKGVNAISRSARLMIELESLVLPDESHPDFTFGPSLTVTALHGGEGFSMVPDSCDMNIDVRLTPSVGAEQVRPLVERAVATFDTNHPGVPRTSITWEQSWPAFRVRDEDPAIACLVQAANDVLGRVIPTSVSGPSNIGNYLASFDVHAMAGFGVTYDNVHATDEWCDLSSLAQIYETYRRAVIAFCNQ